MSYLLIKQAHINDNEDLQDILIYSDEIIDIQPNIEHDDAKVIDAKGNVVLPTFIECHIHPDKAFLEERKPNVSGTLSEALKNTAYLKERYTYDDVYERAQRVIRWCIKNGTTILRAIPDVDPFEKTLGVEVLVDLREKFKDILDMQICAFPQEGIVRHPQVYDYMEQSIKMGADVVGGCPYSEDSYEDTKKHIELVFDLAQKYDLPIDMHADFGTDDTDRQNTVAKLIAEITIERGYQGRVTLGHVTTLGSLIPTERDETLEKLAEADITIVPLPATDMFMNGNEAERNVPRGMAPVKEMIDKGVNVAYASNNIRNAFTPFGNADMLVVGYLLQVSQQMGSASQRRAVVEMGTYGPAKALQIEDTYGLEVGKKADFNIFDAKDISNLINDQPLVQYVIKRGQVLLSNQLKTEMIELLKEDK